MPFALVRAERFGFLIMTSAFSRTACVLSMTMPVIARFISGGFGGPPGVHWALARAAMSDAINEKQIPRCARDDNRARDDIRASSKRRHARRTGYSRDV